MLAVYILRGDMSPIICTSEVCKKNPHEEDLSTQPAASSLLLFGLQPEDLSAWSSMSPQFVLLSLLVVLSFFTAWSSPVCNNQCCRFVENFPARLKKLRQDYSRIRDFYVSKTHARPAASQEVMMRSLTQLFFFSFNFSGSKRWLGHGAAGPERRGFLQGEFSSQKDQLINYNSSLARRMLSK